MKKGFSLLLGIIATLLFTNIVDAEVKYSWKEIKLSENIRLNHLQYVDYADAYYAVGDDYECENVDFTATCNVYSITKEGEVAKANFYYEEDVLYTEQGPVYHAYRYIDADEDGNLAFYSKSNNGYYDWSTWNESQASEEYKFIIDDTLNYEKVYCYDLTADIDIKDPQSRVCLIQAHDDDNNAYYGLVREGKYPGILVQPSRDYIPVFDGLEPASMRSDRLELANHSNGTKYIIASKDGITNIIGDATFDLIDGLDINNIRPTYTYEEDIVFEYTDYSNGPWNNTTNNYSKILFTKDRIISDSYPAPIDVRNVNGFTFIEDPVNSADDGYLGNVKLINMDGSIISQNTLNNYGTQIGTYESIMNYKKDGKVVFFDGYDEIFSVDNTGDKYKDLFDFQSEDYYGYYFFNGTFSSSPYGLRNTIYVLAKEYVEEIEPENTDDDDWYEYSLLEGKDQTFYKKDSKDIVIKIDADVNKFWGLVIDNELVDEKNYTVTEGSTIITLKADYLSTLKEGKHEVVALFDDGYAETTLTVSYKNPKTVDRIVIMGSLLTLSLAGVCVVCKKSKRFN